MLIRIPVILLALTAHEFAHGYVAWRRGDPTAKFAGRLTFNPLVHLDVFGTLMLLYGPFGWAKPVPVESRNLHNPRFDLIWVSIAGPAANVTLAVITGLLYRTMVQFGMLSAAPAAVHLVVRDLWVLNLGLALFNLLPIPPLDGSKVVMSLLPTRALRQYMHFARYAPMVFMGLLAVEWVTDGRYRPFSSLITPLWRPWMAFWNMIVIGGSTF
jgi:Zn-dependent protease